MFKYYFRYYYYSIYLFLLKFSIIKVQFFKIPFSKLNFQSKIFYNSRSFIYLFIHFKNSTFKQIFSKFRLPNLFFNLKNFTIHGHSFICLFILKIPPLNIFFKIPFSKLNFQSKKFYYSHSFVYLFIHFKIFTFK